MLAEIGGVARMRRISGTGLTDAEWCRQSWRMTVFTLLNNDDMVKGVVLLSLEGGVAPGPLGVS